MRAYLTVTAAAGTYDGTARLLIETEDAARQIPATATPEEIAQAFRALDVDEAFSSSSIDFPEEVGAPSGLRLRIDEAFRWLDAMADADRRSR